MELHNDRQSEQSTITISGAQLEPGSQVDLVRGECTQAEFKDGLDEAEWRACHDGRSDLATSTEESDRSLLKDVNKDDASDKQLAGVVGQSEQPVRLRLRYCGQTESHYFSPETTFGQLASKIENRLGIQPRYQKLISKGRRIDLETSHESPLAPWHNQILLIIGSTDAVLRSVRLAERRGNAAEKYRMWRYRKFREHRAWLLRKYETYLQLWLRMVRTNTQRRPQFHFLRTGSKKAAQLNASPAAPERAFGLLLEPPFGNLQQELCALIGFSQSFFPEYTCSHPTRHTAVGCRQCVDQFIIEWVVFVELRLNIWKRRIRYMQRQETNQKCIRELNNEYESCESRFACLKAFWNSAEPDLAVLQAELQDIHDCICFDPDTLSDTKTGAKMASEVKDVDSVLSDLTNLKMGLQILQGAFDVERSATQTLTRMAFLSYPSRKELARMSKKVR